MALEIRATDSKGNILHRTLVTENTRLVQRPDGFYDLTTDFESVKQHILDHYDDDYVFFTCPSTGKEALIIPRKYSRTHLEAMGKEWLHRISVY